MNTALLTLLQLASPALPVGAYSYSEGIETLAVQGRITDGADLLQWLEQELQWGAVRPEAAIVGWVYDAAQRHDTAAIQSWNQWLSAFRETEEMRAQSWQMGKSLVRLFGDLEPVLVERFPKELREGTCNYAIAYSLITYLWEIPLPEARLTYLYSWAANLVSAAVRAVPLGQTEGQRILRQLTLPLQQAQTEIQGMTAADLAACSWGVSLASMHHEVLYSRLFRS